MDLFTIVATIWRHKLATIPVILLTLIGAAYVIVVKPPTYTSNAEILLVYPPSPPTAAQISADPALAKLDTNNPYLTYGNMVLVADVVIDVANSPTAGAKLQSEGVSTKFSVALANSFQSPPVIQVSGTGSNSAVATSSTALVTAEVLDALREIQVEEHVNPTYMITGEEFVKPTVATTSSSSKLRTLIGFAALGLIMILIAVSIAQSLEKRRNARKPAPAKQQSKEVKDPDPPTDRLDFAGDEWNRSDSLSSRPEQQMTDNRAPDRGYRGQEATTRGPEARHSQDPDARGASVGGRPRQGRWPS
jgi:capsular polysaccharide biosynthesis protein